MQARSAGEYWLRAHAAAHAGTDPQPHRTCAASVLPCSENNVLDLWPGRDGPFSAWNLQPGFGTMVDPGSGGGLEGVAITMQVHHVVALPAGTAPWPWNHWVNKQFKLQKTAELTYPADALRRAESGPHKRKLLSVPGRRLCMRQHVCLDGHAEPMGAGARPWHPPILDPLTGDGKCCMATKAGPS